jgi:hypothetical protein
MRSSLIAALCMAMAGAVGPYRDIEAENTRRRNNKEASVRRMVEYERKTKGERQKEKDLKVSLRFMERL